MAKKPLPRKVVNRLAAASALAAALLAAASGCGREKAKPPEMGAPEVTTVTVQPRGVPVVFEFVAQTQSSHQVNIQARVSGFLEKRSYTEGASVRAGQVLFLLDKKPFQAQVDGMAAALARQQAALETARLDLERIRPLAEKHALSQRDLDDATGNYQSTAAAVEQAKSQLETARLNLSYCTITSPIAGISGAALQQEGAYVSLQNSMLTTVAVLSPIWVNFSLSENEMQRYRDQVARGLLLPPRGGRYEVELALVDGSVFPHKGRITFAAPSYNAQTGTFLLRADVANPRGILRPNQFVRARLKGAVRPGAVVVPQRSVQQGAKGQFVWVVNREGKAEDRPVTVGEWHGDGWIVTEGLHSGERVVVDGALTLHPGAPVRIKGSAGDGAAAGAGAGAARLPAAAPSPKKEP